MLNNKGQAFSVFELMIAGVVAFAILILLLSVLSGVIFNPTSDPKNAISTTLKTVGNSGSQMTAVFEIKPNTTVSASNFNDTTSLEAKSIKFFRGQFKESTYPSLVVGETDTGKISYVNWKGAQALRATAQVICGATAPEAADSLSVLDPSKFDYDTGALTEYCQDAQPCCAIVLDKPTK